MLCKSRKWCPGAESNHRHGDFQTAQIFGITDSKQTILTLKRFQKYRGLVSVKYLEARSFYFPFWKAQLGELKRQNWLILEERLHFGKLEISRL